VYLGVPADVLKNPGPVSKVVAELMVRGVLEKTPEADFAAAVTGHLGPNAPPKLDGLVFAAVTRRSGGETKAIKVRRMLCQPNDSRARRQRWAAEQVLEFLGEELERVRGDAKRRST